MVGGCAIPTAALGCDAPAAPCPARGTQQRWGCPHVPSGAGLCAHPCNVLGWGNTGAAAGTHLGHGQCGPRWGRGAGGSGGAALGLYWQQSGGMRVQCRGCVHGGSPGTGHPAQTMPSKPWIPHFLPAIRQPKVRASCRLFPGERGGGQAEPECAVPSRAVAVLWPCPPAESAKMTAALKVSPAPSVSTRVSGGKASECTSSPSGPTASAPASAQAQISVALGGGRWGVGSAAVPPFPPPRPAPHPTPAARGPAAPAAPRGPSGTRSAWPRPC